MMMYSWKITKYAPNYSFDDWISISDVGKVCSGKLLTMEEYLRVEDSYLNAISLIAKCNEISMFEVTDLEVDVRGKLGLIYRNGQTLDLQSSLVLARHILREELWCRLQNPKMFVHFGYDYYMYIGSEKPADTELELIRKLGLYIEEQVSPYM